MVKLSSSFTTFFISLFAFGLTAHAVRVTKDVGEHANVTNIKGLLAGYYHVVDLPPGIVAKTWKGECFQDNRGYLTHNRDHTVYWVRITASNSVSLTCLDYYQFKAGGQVIGTDSIFSSLPTHETLLDTRNEEIRRQVRRQGVSVYIYRKTLNKPSEESIKSSKKGEDMTGSAIEDDKSKPKAGIDDGVIQQVVQYA